VGPEVNTSGLCAFGHRRDICVESVEVTLKRRCREQSTRARLAKTFEDSVIARLIELR